MALKRGEVGVECGLIVICFLLKGRLCHNLNICVSYSSSGQEETPRSGPIHSENAVCSHKEKKQRTVSVNKVSLLQCMLCLLPSVTSDLCRGGAGVLPSVTLHKLNQMFPLRLDKNKAGGKKLFQVSGGK